jgi:hypothetical protein
MSILSKLFGPRSKWDATLPYTYEARIDRLGGQGSEPLFEYYFADTICGLIDYLDDQGVGPDQVELFGVYRKERIPLNVHLCVDEHGWWRDRPHICRTLESHYAFTMQARYRGHVEGGGCEFEDRDRQGVGPY